MNPLFPNQNQGGFQTLGQDFGQENPLAQALMAVKEKFMGPQPTTSTPPPQAAEAPAVSGGGNPLADYIDNSGLAGVAAQIGETLVNKKAADLAEQSGPLSDRDARLLKLKGYKQRALPMGAQGDSIMAGEPDAAGRWRMTV